jgi:hypothetical protein
MGTCCSAARGEMLCRFLVQPVSGLGAGQDLGAVRWQVVRRWSGRCRRRCVAWAGATCFCPGHSDSPLANAVEASTDCPPVAGLCCEEGTSCARLSEWYWQCLPATTQGGAISSSSGAPAADNRKQEARRGSWRPFDPPCPATPPACQCTNQESTDSSPLCSWASTGDGAQ